MMEDQAPVVKDPNPINIPPEKVKVYSMLHKCTPQEAFGALLATDLLERLALAVTADDLKPIIKVLITSVIGDGSVAKV